MTLEQFVTGLFKSLNDKKVLFCVLRNHEGLPYRNFGNDIDILIRSSDKKVAKTILADTKGVRITGYIERAYVFSFFVSGVNWEKNKNAIEIDFVTSLSWKGLSYLNVDLGWRKRPISEFMTYAVVEPSRRRIARDTDCKDSLSIAGGRGAMAPDAVITVQTAARGEKLAGRLQNRILDFLAARYAVPFEGSAASVAKLGKQ